MKNRVFVITGAAGSGKTTVRDYLHDQYKMARVITHTTRAPRANERDGIDYYFEDNESFFDNHFLESVHYAGNYYG
ncbi:guanylate kinase, partial [Lactobacillus parabuchneri]|nr:guanylate kinase [Lentilactobacillus parabuchneri]